MNRLEEITAWSVARANGAASAASDIARIREQARAIVAARPVDPSILAIYDRVRGN